VLDEALEPEHTLTRALRLAIERHLSDYSNVPKFSADDKKRWQREDRELIATARRLQRLIASHSLPDHREAQARGTQVSSFEERLQARIAEWESRQSTPQPASRPQDWDRRILLFRIMGAFDDEGVALSGHRDGVCIRTLREVLIIADSIDGRQPTKGSRRLAQEVWRHYRDRHNWGPRSLLRFRYERDAWWPHSPRPRKQASQPDTSVT
jgi:predicted component of type VI protein secretion system